MAARGRKPDLTSRALDSSHSPTQDVSVLSFGALDHVDYPEEISEPAKGFWDIIAGAMLDAKILRAEHLPLVLETAEAFALASAFRKQLWESMNNREDPHVMGKHRTNWVSATTLAKSYAGELGISPVAQVRLGLLKAKGASLLEALDERKKS